MFGSNNTADRRLASTLAQENKIEIVGGNIVLSDLYRATPLMDDKLLFNVEALPEFMPHLLTFAPVEVERKNLILGDERVFQLIENYIENMTDEEALVIRNQIDRINVVYGIRSIECYKDSFIVHFNMGKKPMSAIIAVLNMVDGVDTFEYAHRTSLN